MCALQCRLERGLQYIGIDHFSDSPWLRVQYAWEIRSHALDVFKMIDVNKNDMLEKREMMTSLQRDQAVISRLRSVPHEDIRQLSNAKHFTKMWVAICTGWV